MLQAAAKHEGELVIAAIGPLTNLALACNLDIGFPQRVKALYVMGGAERAGNVTPASEFNFHCDPEAAHLVLKKFPHAVRSPLPCSSHTSLSDRPAPFLPAESLQMPGWVLRLLQMR